MEICRGLQVAQSSPSYIPRMSMNRRYGAIAVALGMVVWVALFAVRWHGDWEVCDTREVTSIHFDRCIELRREPRILWVFGPNLDVDSIVEAIKDEGLYPGPPYTGPAPPQFDHGPPTSGTSG